MSITRNFQITFKKSLSGNEASLIYAEDPNKDLGNHLFTVTGDFIELYMCKDHACTVKFTGEKAETQVGYWLAL